MKEENRRFLLGTFVLAVLFLCAGSCVTQSAKRKDLEVVPLTAPIGPSDAQVLLRFEEFLPGKPLDGTVCDNYQGTFRDSQESRLIGFTQNYRPLDFLGSNVSPIDMVKTQIVIPFGRLLSETLESTMKKSPVHLSVCFYTGPLVERVDIFCRVTTAAGDHRTINCKALS